MSSSTQQESSTQTEHTDIPEKGTPEYEAYYYKQIEDSVHRTAAIFPDSSIARGWLSLNPVQQRIIISSFLPVKFDPDDIDIDVENREELDFTTGVLFSCRVLDRTRKRPVQNPNSTNNSSPHIIIIMSQSAWKDEVLSRYGLTETDRLIYDAFKKFTNILEAPKRIPAEVGSLEQRWKSVRNMVAKRSVQDYFWRYCSVQWVPAGNVGTVERQQSVANLLGVIAPNALTAALDQHSERSRENTPLGSPSASFRSAGSQESGPGVFMMDL
ncbi:hypothetical protein CVT25_009064 [Psilocybe cyanescens]|uniref:Uncharacterized protein n=1 Tax=Psilocybe cyanescens TaxID=93625 RepID=A0A409XDP0_PSICY|nr:hypothetical protein CVT25_009064 [Psilocybe cyanescens]